MHTDRLLRLAVLLESDANNPAGVMFNLDTWANDAKLDHENAFFYTPETDVIPMDCRTMACGMGLAAISGIFYDEGLTWRINREWLIPTFKGEDGFDAAVLFFDLARGQVHHLFSSDYYPPDLRKGKEAELEVAKRIRALVAKAQATERVRELAA